MNFSGYFTGYRTETPKPVFRVWGKNNGSPAALFEVQSETMQQAIRAVRDEGFRRVMVEIK